MTRAADGLGVTPRTTKVVLPGLPGCGTHRSKVGDEMPVTEALLLVSLREPIFEEETR